MQKTKLGCKVIGTNRIIVTVDHITYAERFPFAENAPRVETDLRNFRTFPILPQSKNFEFMNVSGVIPNHIGSGRPDGKRKNRFFWGGLYLQFHLKIMSRELVFLNEKVKFRQSSTAGFGNFLESFFHRSRRVNFSPNSLDLSFRRN